MRISIINVILNCLCMDYDRLIKDECRLRGYSEKTIKAYTFHVKKFLESKKSAKDYLVSINNADETKRSAGFAIKFYFKILKKELFLPNVKREKKLPVVLSQNEVTRLIQSTKNIKHRLIIQILYSSGLRLNELINLKWQDIDLDRNLIHIKRAKGKKDRIVMLSKKVKDVLNILDQENYVFLTNRNKKYSSRTIQKIIENARIKANIKKRVTPHSLRHSFATHLLENGTDIRYIKELLGHSDIKTTLIYTKVSNKNIMNIKSPLDNLK